MPILAVLFLIAGSPVIAASTLPLRLSTDSTSSQANGGSQGVAISADGRFVVFESWANSLVAGDTNYVTDVFVKDVSSGAVTRVSTDSGGIQGSGDSISPSISADGRYVAFTSWASNLVPEDTNGDPDVFVKDTQTGVTTRVSTSSSGGQAESTLYHNGSNGGTISYNGRFVAFDSYASNLVPGDNNTWDVFVKDMQTGVTARVSTDSSGAQVWGGGQGGSISADGSYVAFGSYASDLVPGGTPGIYDIYRKDTQTGIVTCVSTTSDGARANDGSSGGTSVSPNGRYVAFKSYASNLVTGDLATNCSGVHCPEIYIKDTQTGQTMRVSNDYSTGGQPNGSSLDPSVIDDGRVAFWSGASNLVPGDTNGKAEVFVWDKNTQATTRISSDATGGPGNDHSGGVGNFYSSARYSITADGRFVVFESDASNLVPGDTNGARDIFLASTTAATKKNYWSWYDAQSPSVRNWVLMANTNSSVWNQGFGLDIGNQAMDLSPFSLSGGDCPSGGCAPGEVPLGMTITPSFPGMMGGPVVARSLTDESSLLTSQRVLWGDSLEEVPGIPEEKLSDHYYWPWYDQQSPGFTNWVVVANPGYSQVFYQIKIAGQVMDSGSIVAGSHVAPTFPGVMTGPLEVQAWSDQVGGSSPAKVIASQRVLSDYGKAFNEEPGIPAAELSEHYLWPWYDSQSPGAQDWVLLTNPGAAAVQYSLKIAGNEVASGTLEAAGAQYGLDKVELSFPGSMGGPVEVAATGKVIASQRSLWGPSFEEAPGYPYALLASSYHWTWYDNQSAGANNWVMLANPSPGPVDYTVRIAGSVVTSGTLQPAGDAGGGDIAMPVFPNVMEGPVEVSTTGGNVVASQRVLWSGHFNEVWGTVLE
ncbi:MAG: TolB family protein [Thermoleophilia bacterium]